MSVMSKAKKKKNKAEDKATKVRKLRWDPFALPSLNGRSFASKLPCVGDLAVIRPLCMVSLLHFDRHALISRANFVYVHAAKIKGASIWGLVHERAWWASVLVRRGRSVPVLL
jgi:hypothetical protein